MYHCHYCLTEISFLVLRKNRLCPKCGSDLHCCKNCMHYDENIISKCNEPNSPWVKDKVSQNNCVYFEFRVTNDSIPSSNLEAEKAKRAFKALFKSA